MALSDEYRKQRNRDWMVVTSDDKWAYSGGDNAIIALLSDVRDELRALNRLLRCHRFTGMPDTLKKIEKRLATKLPLKPRRS